jgi:preprotein translocase subunit YajC
LEAGSGEAGLFLFSCQMILPNLPKALTMTHTKPLSQKIEGVYSMARLYYFLLMISTTALAFAQDTVGSPTPPSVGESLRDMLFMMAILFAIFYFILIRPQQKQRQKHENRINSLKKGDKIIGAGGIYGEIIGIDEEKAVIAVGKDKIKLEILKSSITHILSDQESK